MPKHGSEASHVQDGHTGASHIFLDWQRLHLREEGKQGQFPHAAGSMMKVPESMLLTPVLQTWRLDLGERYHGALFACSICSAQLDYWRKRDQRHGSPTSVL